MRHHQLAGCKAVSDKLKRIYDGLSDIISECRPDVAVVENIFCPRM